MDNNDNSGSEPFDVFLWANEIDEVKNNVEFIPVRSVDEILVKALVTPDKPKISHAFNNEINSEISKVLQ